MMNVFLHSRLIYVSYISERRFRRSRGACAYHSMLPGSAVIPLLSFMLLLLSASLCGLAASGHFPREHRAPTLRSGFGRFILFGSLALCILCLFGGIALIWHAVPWYAAVIGGGGIPLAAPRLLQPFPHSF